MHAQRHTHRHTIHIFLTHLQELKIAILLSLQAMGKGTHVSMEEEAVEDSSGRREQRRTAVGEGQQWEIGQCRPSVGGRGSGGRGSGGQQWEEGEEEDSSGRRTSEGRRGSGRHQWEEGAAEDGAAGGGDRGRQQWRL
jgi:hypothetical protein